MTTTDIGVILIVAVSTVVGLAKGLLRSTLTTAAAVGGIVVAASGYPRLAPIVRPAFETDVLANLMAFLLIYLGLLLGAFVVSRLLRRSLEKMHLGWLDSLGGAAFGLARGWLVCSVIYVALSAFPLETDLLDPMTTKPYLRRGATFLTQLTSEAFQRTLRPTNPELQKEPTHPPPPRKDKRS